MRFWLKTIARCRVIVFLLTLTACGDTNPTTLAPSPTPTLQPTAIITPNPSTPTVGPLPTLNLPTTTPLVTATPTQIPPTDQPFSPTTRQILPPACCRNFGFSPDNKLYYYDKPAGQPKPATYLFDPITSQSQQLFAGFGNFSSDLSLVAVSNSKTGLINIEKVKDGSLLAKLPHKTTEVIFSPDNSHLAYLVRSSRQDGPEEPQLFELWAEKIDGTELRTVSRLREGANLAWFPDNRRLLLTARDEANQRFGLWVIDLESGKATLVVESKGLIAASLSSDGEYLAYAVTLQSKSEIWLAKSDGTQAVKMGWVGGWRWSSSSKNELYYIPARSSGETANALWVYNLTTEKANRLTDPAILPLKIALDEWQMSPDNKTLVYRNAVDNALWLLRFRN